MAIINFASKTIILLSFFLLVLISYSLPLSTNKRWIIDAKSGERVKLACVTWASHMEPMLAEGLDKKPLSYLASKLSNHRFNCVRLTWASYMFTRYHKLSVAHSFESLNLTKAKAGLAIHNPNLLNMSVVEAFKSVVDELGAHGLMVVLDNHVSLPKWCCPQDDGNGFFGDVHFDPTEWLIGLAIVAKLFKGKPQVVAMSMRNELHGPYQNELDWYKFIQQGATMVHKLNPQVLVVVSGLVWGTDLTFLKKKPLSLGSNNLDNQLVYETHWYSFAGDPKIWEVQPLNRICNLKSQILTDLTGFVITGENPVPLFLGEVGIDQRGVNEADNRFFNCFLAYVAENDLDWGLWAFQGSYYFKDGETGHEETYGLMNFDWDEFRNPEFDDRLWLIKQTMQDTKPKFSTSYLMYHPQSGRCVNATENNEIYATKFQEPSLWSHDGDGAPLRLMGSAQCLKAIGDGLEPVLSRDCLGQPSSWISLSNSKLQLGVRNENGDYLCLEMESFNSSKILTRKCICIEDDSDCQENPQSQWFKLVKNNVKVAN
ncbi:glycosyl hydrolase 5 family protein-like [Mercurialis annua]|uniref:glycosyl hydrolase 5 family protein-like n=1 Tax=Mercurialis annua TaxID=3986 RepID=UPI00215F5AA0|nr:glycosyl hydrolase 5 family protein-like [Mercurialis annua]